MNLIFLLETESLSPEVYRYRTEWGISVVYYMFDIQNLEEFIFESIYLYTEDIEYLGRTGEELFQTILDYGSDCLVLFYDDFSTSYGYMSLVRVKNPDGFAEALGGGKVRVSFRRAV